MGFVRCERNEVFSKSIKHRLKINHTYPSYKRLFGWRLAACGIPRIVGCRIPPSLMHPAWGTGCIVLSSIFLSIDNIYNFVGYNYPTIYFDGWMLSRMLSGCTPPPHQIYSLNKEKKKDSLSQVFYLFYI